ncbi:MAG: amidohydrolase family protein [Clostridia bacterium]|nr:amidohydrolase family protein [Clostridia bacterium]
MATLLKNCKIYDGTGADAFMGSVLFEDDKILEVGEVDESKAEKVFDLGGKSLASGFIDIHSHNDWFCIKEEPMKYFAPFIQQGITTFVTGNCGCSAIGFDEAGRENADLFGGGIFHFGGTTGKYGNIKDFNAACDKKMPCNAATCVGHGSARAAVSGLEARDLTPDEMDRMLGIIEDNLKNGAAGVSLGLMYEPGLYAPTEELKKVAELCCKYNKPLTVHPRAESKYSMSYDKLFGRSHLLRAEDELYEIAHGTNLKLQHSHAIFVGTSSFKDVDEFLEIQEKLRAEGVDAMFDIYDHDVGVSVITVVLPPWYQGMSKEERKKPINKIKLWGLITATAKLLGFGFDDIQVAYIGEGYEEYEGYSVHELAKKYGKSDLDMYLELCEKSNFKGRVNQGPYISADIIKRFEHNPNCLYMTDAWVEDYGVQNPSIYDCFPKFLQDSLKGTGDTLPNTVRRMTGANADRFMLKDRGYVKPGYYADFTVFNEDEILAATPNQTHAFGIDKVFINGKLVCDENVLDEEICKTSGRALVV